MSKFASCALRGGREVSGLCRDVRLYRAILGGRAKHGVRDAGMQGVRQANSGTCTPGFEPRFDPIFFSRTGELFCAPLGKKNFCAAQRRFRKFGVFSDGPRAPNPRSGGAPRSSTGKTKVVELLEISKVPSSPQHPSLIRQLTPRFQIGPLFSLRHAYPRGPHRRRPGGAAGYLAPGCPACGRPRRSTRQTAQAIPVIATWR